VIAAVNVSTSAVRRDPEDVLADFLAPLLETAKRIEDDLASAGRTGAPGNR